MSRKSNLYFWTAGVRVQKVHPYSGCGLYGLLTDTVDSDWR